jgi:hypothetical protein
MNKFLRNNQKKLMAIFGVVLMIAFVVPTLPHVNQNVEKVVGYLGDQKITADDVQSAANEWDLLSRQVGVRSSSGESQWQPIIGMLGQEGATAIQQRPELYYLLQVEARRMGLVPPYADTDQMLADPRVGIHMPDGSIIPLADVPDPARRNNIRESVARLMMVQNAFLRAADAIKVSKPLIDHQLAERLQQLKVYVTDFDASAYAEKVEPPTTQQLTEQFNKYADIEKTAGTSETNPFGFGYKYPDRIKFDYIAIQRDEVRKAVKAMKDDYAWEVQAHTYYLQHQDQFPTTEPATTQESLSLGPTTRVIGPSTRPFEAVREQVLSRLIEPEVDRRMNEIQNDITSRMAQDFDAYKSSHAGSTTAPATAPAGGYASFDYLQKLANDVQARRKVTLRVASLTDQFRTAEELANIEGIGKATYQSAPFSMYATLMAAPFLTDAAQNQAMVLDLYEPSRPLTDEDRTAYIFRVTDAQKAHKPASMEEVKEQVEKDWRQARAFELAKADAEKLAEEARKTGLKEAAGDRKVVMTGKFSTASMGAIENYDLPSTAAPAFIRGTFDLVSQLSGDSAKTKPIGVIEMPEAGKVAVAELIYVDSAIKPESLEMAQSIFMSDIVQQFQMALAQQWYDFDAVAQRTGFRPYDAAATK